MKRVFSIFSVLLFAGATASAGQRGVTDDEILLGSHTDLSGAAAAWGVGSINAARLRFEEANERGGIHGRKIRLIVEDNQYQVPRAVQAANKLLNRDKIFAMFLAIGTPMNNAVRPRQLAAGVPNLFPGTWARSSGEPFHRLQFALPSTYYSQLRAAVRYFVEEREAKKVCSMVQDTDYGQEIADGVKDQLTAMGMKEVAHTAHRPTDTDFNAALLKLKGAGCDLVALGTIVRDTILIVSSAKKMGWDVPFVGAFPAHEMAVAEAEGSVTEGLYAMSIVEAPYLDAASPEAKKFYDAYEKRFGHAPQVPALVGYTFADVVVVALEKAGRELTVDRLIEALESIQGYRDPFGGPTLTFGPKKHRGSEESFLSQVQGGRWVRVTDPLSY